MLRSFELIQQDATSETVIASGEGQLAVSGGGSGYSKSWHWHDCTMLILPNIGSVEIRHEEHHGGAWISEEEFAIIPASRAHATRAFRDKNAHVAYYVTDSAMKQLEGEFGSFSRLRSKTRTVAAYKLSHNARTLRNLCTSHDSGGAGASTIRRHLSSALLIQCLITVQGSGPSSSASHREQGTALAWEVKAFISANAESVLSIDSIADRFGISRRHVTRLFRDSVGMSIGEFHQSARLEAARRLLTDTDLPVGQIAFRVGFDSGSALARALRRREGCSPSELRPRSARSGAR